MIRRISLTTDFSGEGETAFLTALALAVACRARLEIVHVGKPGQKTEWEHFPRVREVLEGWRLLPRGSRQEDVARLLGVEVGKIEIHGSDAAAGVAEFMAKHRPDLLVAASHGRTGLNGWFAGSVAMDTVQRTALPSLLLGPAAQAPVDRASGTLQLKSALFPVAAHPSPLAAVRSFHDLFGFTAMTTHYVHVPEDDAEAASLQQIMPEAATLSGEVVPAILGACRRVAADLVVMPTAGQEGFMDAMRGSTTQRVLRDAPCALLALPSVTGR